LTLAVQLLQYSVGQARQVQTVDGLPEELDVEFLDHAHRSPPVSRL
jgi:hypothetical protein